MLESMLGADTMKKMMATLMGLVFAILAFIGMILIVFTSINPMFHAHFWPALLSVGCAGAWLGTKGKWPKMGLSGIAFMAALWVLLNSLFVWVESPVCEECLGELLTPIAMAVSATGALLAIFGSLLGILGAKKYLD